jgi:hypothetical protein
MIFRKLVRYCFLASSLVLIGASLAVCQEPFAAPAAPPKSPQTVPGTTDGAPAAIPLPSIAPVPDVNAVVTAPSGPNPFEFGPNNSTSLNGTQAFDHFIGFISNPTYNIDPRALSELYPVFASGWASGNGPLLPNANAQIYGAGLTVALSDRLAIGLNQGGYGVININSNLASALAARGLPVPNRDLAGQREGWLNLGGFVQYTFIADAEQKFLLSGGLRWEAPSGTEQLFQGGANPAYLAPYFSAGKEFGCWHVLAVGGFEFPTGEGTATADTWYLSLHIDRQIGWFYPLVEFNGEYHNKTVNPDLPIFHNVLNLGGFDSSGNILTVSVGANAVIVPSRLEFGAVYTRPITAQEHFDFNGMLAKMVIRF